MQSKSFLLKMNHTNSIFCDYQSGIQQRLCHCLLTMKKYTDCFIYSNQDLSQNTHWALHVHVQIFAIYNQLPDCCTSAKCGEVCFTNLQFTPSSDTDFKMRDCKTTLLPVGKREPSRKHQSSIFGRRSRRLTLRLVEIFRRCLCLVHQ